MKPQGFGLGFSFVLRQFNEALPAKLNCTHEAQSSAPHSSNISAQEFPDAALDGFHEAQHLRLNALHRGAARGGVAGDTVGHQPVGQPLQAGHGVQHALLAVTGLQHKLLQPHLLGPGNLVPLAEACLCSQLCTHDLVVGTQALASIHCSAVGLNEDARQQPGDVAACHDQDASACLP